MGDKPQNEIAEAMLIVIRRVAKWLGVGVLIVLVAGSGIGASFWGYDYITVQYPKSKVSFVVTADSKICEEVSHPVYVAVMNNSSKTIKYTSVSVEARLPGHSTNYANYDAKATSDKIIAPGEQEGACWMFPLDRSSPKGKQVADFEWSTSYSTIRFMDD